MSAAFVLALVLIMSFNTVGIVIVKKRRIKARRKHRGPSRPAPLPPVNVVSDVPLYCPVCFVKFGSGQLSEFNGIVAGSIAIKGHNCVKAGAA